LLVEAAIFEMSRSCDTRPSYFLEGWEQAIYVAQQQHWLLIEKNYIGEQGMGLRYNVAPEQHWPLEGYIRNVLKRSLILDQLSADSFELYL
jgi:hypothetical protein